MATSKAHMRATAKYEKNNYFKTLVRFKKEDEERIRNAAGDSLNGFIVKCVLDKLNGEEGCYVVIIRKKNGIENIETSFNNNSVNIKRAAAKCDSSSQKTSWHMYSKVVHQPFRSKIPPLDSS